MQIYLKLEKIWNELTAVPKNTHVKFGSTDYWASNEEDVIGALRPLLLKYHLLILPHQITHFFVDGKVTFLGMDYKCVDTETAEFIVIPSVGAGHDSSDKGPGKAFTYSLKYLLIKSHMLIQGDDPDQDASEKNAAGDVKAEEDYGILLVSARKKIGIDREIGKIDDEKQAVQLEWINSKPPAAQLKAFIKGK